jgi:hypothetical protein
MDNDFTFVAGSAAAAAYQGTQVAIHRGFPNPAADISEQPHRSPLALDFNQLLVRSAASTFVLRLSGPDRPEHGILSGDLAVVDRAARGPLVIAWDGDQFILDLRSQLPEYASVWGSVTGIVRCLPL